MNIENSINVCICGHSQIGKSTILGHLLFELGLVSEKIGAQYKEKAYMLGEKEHMYALVMHLLKDEEEIKKTIYPSRVRIKFPEKDITLIDTPGHQDYYKNMIFGIFQADCAILVVESPKGFQKETFSILNILRGFGIQIVGVIVSKIDLVEYSETVFNEIKEQTIKHLRESSFETEGIKFCAISGLYGEGLTENRKLSAKVGNTLYSVLNDLNIQIIRGENPLRLTVRRREIKKVKGSGTVAVGEIETGVLNKNDEIIFEPISAIRQKKVIARVKSIQLAKGVVSTPGVFIDRAVPRNIVGISIINPNLDLYKLLTECGNVAGPLSDPPTIATEFLAEITVVDHPVGLSRGYVPVIHPHVDYYPGRIDDILSKKTLDGEWKKDNLDFVYQNEQAIVRIHTERSIAIEENRKIPSLSKFIIRSPDRIVGFGSCIEIIKP